MNNNLKNVLGFNSLEKPLQCMCDCQVYPPASFRKKKPNKRDNPYYRQNRHRNITKTLQKMRKKEKREKYHNRKKEGKDNIKYSEKLKVSKTMKS
jgi:hypothetical protein